MTAADSRAQGLAQPSEGGRPALQLKLQAFEGPLDLLLHLIRSQQLDVRDIPIARVTEQYLAYLDLMQELDVDLAGEWLVVAATLVHIKSKMLLPPEPSEEPGEEGDPRDELVRRLLEYERFKAAGRELGSRDLLGRDVFARLFEAPELSDPAVAEAGPRPFAAVSLAELLTAFARAMANRPRHTVHEVVVERVSLADKMTALLDRLASCESLAFEDLFPPEASRAEIVVSFLALLELIRLRAIRAYQASEFGAIRVVKGASYGRPLDLDIGVRGGSYEPPPDNPPASSVGPAKPGLLPEEPPSRAEPVTHVPDNPPRPSDSPAEPGLLPDDGPSRSEPVTHASAKPGLPREGPEE